MSAKISTICRECGVQLTCAKAGRAPSRCATCKKKRRLRLKRESARKWREVHKAHAREQTRRWRQANKEARKVARVLGVSISKARDWLARQEPLS